MNKTETIKQTETEFLTSREAVLRKKYKRIVEGTIRRETEGSHAGKLTVGIRCATKDCPNVRRVATSDLFQVKYCEECTVLIRNKKRRAKAKAEKAAKTEKTVKTVKKGLKNPPKKGMTELPAFTSVESNVEPELAVVS